MSTESKAESKAARLADEIRRTIDGDPWHGPCLMETLRGITAEQAVQRVSVESHTIWELSAHIAMWHQEMLAVVAGRAYRSVSEAEQWPPIATTTATAWSELLKSIQTNNARLAKAVAVLTDAQLARPIENRDYDLEFLLHGIAQHNAYHSGQIALLKRLLT